MGDETSLELPRLNEAVKGTAAAIRMKTRLQPAGGAGDKVFPPTYEGGEYARETRRLPDGSRVDCVVLDTVQSQANRLEHALLEARREATRNGAIPIDLIDGETFIDKLKELEIGLEVEEVTVEEITLDEQYFDELGNIG